MIVSEVEQASRVRMSTAAAEVTHALGGIIEQMPDLTYVELATALMDVAQRQLLHQWRAEINEAEADRG